MIQEIKQCEQVKPLFADWQETLIWSCLQGVMGHVYVDSVENPSCAMALLGDFCFFAGKPNKELLLFRPKGWEEKFLIMTPQNEAWGKLIEDCYGARAKKVTRYAIKKEPDIFDIEKLEKAVNSLPESYSLQMLDEVLFQKCKKAPWSRDFVSLFSDFAMFEKYGLGVIALKDNEPISGASSYSTYQGGIEIEVDTKEEYRRQGLAYSCCAKLILECLKRGWYPSWDAQNLWSVGLAEKLGYHFDHEYVAYEV